MSIPLSVFTSYLFSRAKQENLTPSGTFELTSRCNLNCRMCYIHRSGLDGGAKSRELDGNKWIHYAEMARDNGLLFLLLTGGEPLLHPDFRKIYKACCEMGLLVSINTNGTRIDRDMAEFFRQNPPARVNVTLYGMSEQTYENLCGSGKAFSQAMNAIELLHQAGVPMKLKYSVTPYNREDLAAAYAFAESRGGVLQADTYMMPPVRACEHGVFCADRLSPEMAAEAQWEYDSLRFDAAQLRKRAEQLRAHAAPEDTDIGCFDDQEYIRCRAGDTTFWVTADGHMRPCGLMTVPDADIDRLGFMPAVREIQRLRKEIPVPKKCSGCKSEPVCHVCPAICHAETGRFSEAPEYVCAKTEAYVRLVSLSGADAPGK